MKLKQSFKNFQQTKSLGSDGFTGEFYQIFKGELMPIIHKLCQKTEEYKTLASSLYEVSIALTPWPDKDITKKETCRQYP